MPAVDRVSIDSSTGAIFTGPGLDATLVPSASYTTTQTSPDLITVGSGVIVVLNATVNAGGLGSVTITIQGKDATSGKYFTLLAGAAVTTVSTNVYTVAPGLVAAANSVANMVTPRTIRVLVTANNANPMTYSVGASVIAA